ncbi:MAG TPA: hypothetical protein VJ111_16220 [Chitinophagaceae bacterium]|nr:hypothetical protein [Chitinophagaceae bacterium]
MTAIRTYKHFIAAILLALYAFVSSPTQLWHHHNIPERTSSSTSESAKHDTISNASGSNSESSCQTCSHKYSTYNGDAVFPVGSSLAITAAKNGRYCLPLISTPSFPLPNKGPPALSGFFL